MNGWKDGFLESFEVGFYLFLSFLFFSSLFWFLCKFFILSCILFCHSSFFFFFFSLYIFCSIFCIPFCPFTIHILLFIFIRFLLVHYLELL